MMMIMMMMGRWGRLNNAAYT